MYEQLTDNGVFILYSGCSRFRHETSDAMGVVCLVVTYGLFMTEGKSTRVRKVSRDQTGKVSSLWNLFSEEGRRVTRISMSHRLVGNARSHSGDVLRRHPSFRDTTHVVQDERGGSHV